MLIKSIDDKKDQINTLEKLLPISADKKGKILHELSILKKGYRNEQNVAYLLDRAFADKQNTLVLHDLRLEYGGYVSQIDHLLVNAGGIYLLESKYFSQTLEIDQNGNWIAKYGEISYTIPSPVEQNRRHISHLQKIMDAYDLIPKRLGIKIDLPFYHFVLVNTNCTLKGTIPSNVIKAESIESTLYEHWDREMDKYFWLNSFKILANLMTHNEMSKIAKTFFKLHKPLTINYAKKFGILAPDQQLLTKLHNMRTQLATKAQIAPQAILNDQTLYMLAAIKPKTPKEIQSLPSITHTKYAQYGYKFLNLILAHQKELTTTT